VARVVGAWGVKGAIKVKPFAAEPQALFSSKRWYLLAPEVRPSGPRPNKASDAAPPWPRLLRIVRAREQGEHVVASAEDIDDRDAAQALRGARLFVSRTSFPTPADDEYYWVDLIGLEVRNRQGTRLGTVVGLIETGPTCVLRVQLPAAGRVDAERDLERGAEPAAARAGEDAGERTGERTGERSGEGDERLIPFVSNYVDRVDLAGRCVHVDWQPDY
jgi:16S rRNA processing protein RimM